MKRISVIAAIACVVFLPVVIIDRGCSHEPDRVQQLIGLCKASQAQVELTQEMLREIIKENPGIVITNMDWWVAHGSTQEIRDLAKSFGGHLPDVKNP